MGDLFDVAWIRDHAALIWSKFVEHVELTVIAVVLGFVISFALSLIAFRYRRAYPPIAWVAGVLYTIPSLALFVLLIPFTALTKTTAEIGLVSYTLLILIRNIVTGLDSVPEDALEAARGMGFTERQLLWKVQLPLAMPLIVAGLRIATVTTIGLVTVAALIGQGGLGYFILLGFREFFATPTIMGSVLVALLAVAADALILLSERRITPWARVPRETTFI